MQRNNEINRSKGYIKFWSNRMQVEMTQHRKVWIISMKLIEYKMG